MTDPLRSLESHLLKVRSLRPIFSMMLKSEQFPEIFPGRFGSGDEEQPQETKKIEPKPALSLVIGVG